MDKQSLRSTLKDFTFENIILMTFRIFVIFVSFWKLNTSLHTHCTFQNIGIIFKADMKLPQNRLYYFQQTSYNIEREQFVNNDFSLKAISGIVL